MSGRTIAVAAAIDDTFANGLLVTLHSAARNLSPGWKLETYVFGFEITPASRARVDQGLAGLPVRLHWRKLDLSAVDPYWPGLNNPRDTTCYYRLFLGDTLPETVDRVLFLDADLLIHRDLAELWHLPFEGNIAMAVPDAYPRGHRSRLSRIAFADGQRFTGDTPYFNAGVQLIDLSRWRTERIGSRACELLWKYKDQLDGRDQDALNITLAGRWKRLPPTWNFHELPEGPDDWDAGGASPTEVADAVRHPAILHYIGWKPWSRAWRPHRSRLWWRAARAAGVATAPRILHVAIWDALFWGPHTRLRWLLRRANHRGFALLMLMRPWTAVTYPLWRLTQR
ncbi:MAG: glycosyltransferase family 8 protein [Vicinamibacterales bacterium]